MKPPQVSSFYSIPALRKLALRACLVNAKLDPVGKGKSIVGKGVGTVPEKLAWVHLAGLKRLMAACENCTLTPHLELKLGEKKSPFVDLVFETPCFKHNFSKTHVHRVILKIKSQLPNLISNFETHKNVRHNFL